MTLKEWTHIWLSVVERNCSDNTVLVYRKAVKTFEPLSGFELKILTSSQILTWNMGLSCTDNYKAHVNLVLKICLSFAIKMGFLDKNPVQTVIKTKKIKQLKAKWTAEEIKRFIKESEGSKYFKLFYLALATGARLGELLGLKYEDVLGSDLIIERQALEVAGRRFIGAPKTGGRRLRLSPEDRMKLGFGQGFIFLNSEGRQFHKAQIYKEFYKVLARAQVPKINFHDLRHLNATYLLSSGVPIKVVSERLGHASVSTTLDIYAHSLQTSQKEAAEVMNKVLT